MSHRVAVALVALVVGLAFIPLARAQEAGDEPAHQLTKAPKLTHFVEAVYPLDKKAKGITSSVLLSIEIDEAGKVTNVEVVKSGGDDFDAAAVAAAQQFVFSPAEVDGQPAPVKITYRYDFTIQQKMVSLGPQVNFEGVVKERFKKKPLAGVTVRIKDLDRKKVTGADGHFEFIDVPPGTHQVELSGPQLVTVSTQETITKGKKKTVTYLVEQQQNVVAGFQIDEETIVRAPRIKKESVETTIRTEEARKVPGTQGDTLKVVQNLPGVGRSSFGSGQLIVWGSSPKETRIYVDGVEIPTLYHGGGVRSVINSNLVRSIELSPGGYGAEYGRGLGGLVKVGIQPPPSGFHGHLSADFTDSSAMLSVSPTKRLRLAMAGRYSYLDRSLKLVTSKDVNDYVPIPRYYDSQILGSYHLGKDQDLTFLGLLSDDKLRRTITSSDPAEVRSEVTHDGFWRAIVRYSKILPDGSSFTVTPSVGRDLSESTQTFGPVPITNHVTAWQYSVRGDYRSKLNDWATMQIGIDVRARRTRVHRFGTISLPAREGDIYVWGQPPGEDVNVDTWHTTILAVAPYLFTQLSLGKKLTVTPGLRIEPTLINGDELTPYSTQRPANGYRRFEWAFDPRLQAQYDVNKRLSFKLGGGLYHQPPDPEDMSPVFGNPTLGLESAAQGTLGAKYKLTGTLSLEVVGFAKYLWNLVSRNDVQSPPVGQVLLQERKGRSYGGQVLLRQEIWKGFFGWISYSLMRSERKDHPGQGWRLFDYDQTHVLSVLASYQLGKGWEAGARFRYATGFPRTPVVGSFYVPPPTDLYQPEFGAQNSIRIPAFYQLDFRIDKTITRPGFRMNIYLDVQNVTNRKNPEEIVYNYDYTKRGYITGLPTLAILGASLEF